MAQLNTTLSRAKPIHGQTHEGAPAAALTTEQQLRRSVMACMLWENTFYEDGQTIADRIDTLSGQVSAQVLSEIAIEAREQNKLRHAPLLLLSALAKHQGPLVGQTIERVIQRADELTELLAIYWRNGKRPLSKQMKLGLGGAFRKFDAYQLAKYDRANAIRLRDVLFLTHAKPKDGEQAALWAKLAAQTLESPDTWEVALSGGADKKETFERLLRDGKLGYLALLRNLRGMDEAKVEESLIKDAILARRGADRVLPFRFVAAARAAPRFEPVLDQALVASLDAIDALPGKTAVLVDVSGSMDTRLSAKSDLTRIDAAAALGSIIPGDVRVFSFSTRVVEVPPRKGMAGVDTIKKSQPHSGTLLGQAINTLNQNVEYDRLIVITDEQSRDAVPGPKGKGYMINVAAYQNGVGYGPWTRIDGFSESVLKYIYAYERSGA